MESLNQIEALREQLTTLLNQLKLNDAQIRVYQEHQDSLKAVDADSKAIEDQKAMDKHRAAVYRDISSLYAQYLDGRPVFYEIIYQELLKAEVFSIKYTKEENLKQFDNLVCTSQFTSKGQNARELYKAFIESVRGFCEDKLDELEAEAIITLQIGVQAALAMQEGARDESQ